MATLELPNQRLRSSQADQIVRHERAAKARFWWPILNVPGRRGVNRGDGKMGLLQSFDDGRERITNFPREAEALLGVSLEPNESISIPTENSVDNMVRGLDGR
jgi:hypothetical protein